MLTQQPAPGHRDTAYGEFGDAYMPQFTTTIHRTLTNIAVDDDYLLVCGLALDGDASANYALTRFDDNGDVDLTFGDKGRLSGKFLPSEDAALEAVTRLDDRRILVAGWSGKRSEFRIKPLIAWCSGDGQGFTAWQRLAIPDQLTHLPGSTCLSVEAERILVGLNMADSGLRQVGARVFVTDLEGAPGLGGRAHLDVLAEYGVIEIAGVTHATDGFVVAGTRTRGDGSKDGFICRYDFDGALDSTFADQGIRWLSRSGQSLQLGCLAARPDGTLLVGGKTWQADAEDAEALLWQFTSDGEPDVSFNAGKPLLTRLPGAPGGQWIALAFQQDGAVVTLLENHTVIYRRWMQDGRLDPDHYTGERLIGVAEGICCVDTGKRTMIGHNAASIGGTGGTVVGLHA